MLQRRCLYYPDSRSALVRNLLRTTCCRLALQQRIAELKKSQRSESLKPSEKSSGQADLRSLCIVFVPCYARIGLLADFFSSCREEAANLKASNAQLAEQLRQAVKRLDTAGQMAWHAAIHSTASPNWLQVSQAARTRIRRTHTGLAWALSRQGKLRIESAPSVARAARR